MLELENTRKFFAGIEGQFTDVAFIRTPAFADRENVLAIGPSEEFVDEFMESRAIAVLFLGEVFTDLIKHVAAETVHAEGDPKIDHRFHFIADFGIFPVEVGLADGVGM